MNNLWILELQELDEAQRKRVEKFAQRDIRVSKDSKNIQLQGSKQQIDECIEQLHLINRIKYRRSVVGLPLSTAQVVDTADTVVGQSEERGKFWMMAGPCSAESPEQLKMCIEALSAHQINWLRAGIFKPRSSPYAFQGHGSVAQVWLRELKKDHEFNLISELLDPRDIDEALDVVDMIQIGARNMHNTSLLKAVADCNRPVLLKRGWGATYQEWLGSAEYLLFHGAKEVLLCERGIRTFETHTRFTLDINAVAVMKELTSLPIIVDPSHATGQRRWVLAAARAAVAAGADGLLVEVHPNPKGALSDADQSLPLEALDELVKLQKMRLWMQQSGML